MHSEKNLFYAGSSRQDIIKNISGVSMRPPGFKWLRLIKQNKERRASRMGVARQTGKKLVHVATQTGSAIVVPWMHGLLATVRSTVPAKLICNCEWTSYIKGRHWRTTVMCILIPGILFIIQDSFQSVISKWRRLTQL